MVDIRGLTKIFPVRKTWAEIFRRPFSRETTTVVRDVTFSVRPGEFFGLLGPNGAGKTTLFKMLATLILPDGGTASVRGHDVQSDARAVRRTLTPVIPDERSLYWRLSALENLRLFATLNDLRGPEKEGRCHAALEGVGLADTGDKMVGQFSSGMKQRLLIARALLSRPAVLLLDEPTRSLDPISARDFRRFLREELASRQGVTVLLATHNAEEALELCDRLAVLHRGQLQAVGTVDELKGRVGDDTYRVRLELDRESRLDELTHLEGAHDLVVTARDGAWTWIEAKIPGGSGEAAAWLGEVVRRGMPVSGFEPRDVTLAELLERIVAQDGGPDA
jgi:ABC-2 type transport system ATP-binding protein